MKKGRLEPGRHIIKSSEVRKLAKVKYEVIGRFWKSGEEFLCIDVIETVLNSEV